MSRNAEEGIKLYFELFDKGIELIFLKERYINTDIYKDSIYLCSSKCFSNNNCSRVCLGNVFNLSLNFRKTDGIFIGEVNVHRNPNAPWHEMGIVLEAKYRGNGYGTDSADTKVPRNLGYVNIVILS